MPTVDFEVSYGKASHSFPLDPQKTKLRDLKALLTHVTGLPASRQRIGLADTGKAVAIDDSEPLGKLQSTKLSLRDLGPQFSWKGVFLLEYAGPLVIHLVWILMRLPWLGSFQIFAGSLVILHYAKRIYETINVHQFSHPTMPLGNLFKNCLYYWGLGGVGIGWEIYAIGYKERPISVPKIVLCEAANGYTHLILSRLRDRDPKARGIPRGFGFDLVSCPNYFFESAGWAAYAFLTATPLACLFALLGTLQMYSWAVKKHQRYLSDFPNQYPRSRRAMFPWLL